MDKKRIEKELRELESLADKIKEKIQYIREIIWDKQSQKESSSMYGVLDDSKPHTKIKSKVGEILVDKDFMQKELKKHLDEPSLRGMITKEELLSFPKVAKNVEPIYNPQQQGYDWKVKTDDDKILTYGERDFGEGHRLLTAHTNADRGERGHSHRQISDPDFHKSADNIIPQKQQKDLDSNKKKSQDLDDDLELGM